MRVESTSLLIIWLLIGWVVGFFVWKNIKNETIKWDFEQKVACVKYFDTYKKYLEKNYKYENDEFSSYISDYEMFYSKKLDTCISAYSIYWDIKENWKTYRNYWYYIVDYLNWEKSLFGCKVDNYVNFLNADKPNWWVECLGQWNKEKERYKSDFNH